MIRCIINYIRSCHCGHTWERVTEQDYYNGEGAKMPYKRIIVYRCTSCGLTQKIKL